MRKRVGVTGTAVCSNSDLIRRYGQDPRILLYWPSKVVCRSNYLLQPSGPDQALDYSDFWGHGRAITSRNSTARYRDNEGVLRSAGSGELRERHYVFDQNGVLVPSTLLEAARTNELTRSEDLTHGDWTKNNTSITADQATGPDGVVSLDEIVEDGTASVQHEIRQDLTGLTADAEYTCSVWAIADTRSWLRLELFETASPTNKVRAWFDLSSGSIGTTAGAGTGSFTRAYVEDWTGVAAGLYRLVLVGSVGNSATAISAEVGLATQDNEAAYSGDGSSSLYAGYAQVEDDAEFASSYIATTTAPVSRSADSLYYPFTHDPQEMTVYVKFVERGTLFTGNNTVLFTAGGPTNPKFKCVVKGGGTTYTVQIIDSDGNFQQVAVTGPTSIGQIVEGRFVLHSDGSVEMGLSIDGGVESTAGPTSPVTNGLEAAWGEQLFRLNEGSGGVGHNAFIDVKVASGIHTMDGMRTL